MPYRAVLMSSKVAKLKLKDANALLVSLLKKKGNSYHEMRIEALKRAIVNLEACLVADYELQLD